EIGGSYGNTNAGASNEMGEWEAWIKAGTGDDKTDIVVIADFWERLNGLFSRDRDLSSNGNQTRFGGFDNRSGNFPGRVGSVRLLRSEERRVGKEWSGRRGRGGDRGRVMSSVSCV